MMITDEFKKSFGFYNQVVLLFSFILGIAYLVGFWRTFDVNIFPFLSLFDLIRYAAYPVLILYVPLLLLQWLMMELHIASALEKLVLYMEAHFNPVRRRVIGLACFALIIGLGIYFKITTFMIGIPVITIIIVAWRNHIVQKQDTNDANLDMQLSHRFGKVLLLFCLLPFVSYDVGHCHARSIFNGKEYSYVVGNADGSKVLFKFLGLVNERYFFIDENNHTLLINSNVNTLELRHFLKKGEKDNPEIGLT